MHILSVLMMFPHVSSMSMFLITILAIIIISTVMARPSFFTSKSSSSQDLDSSYKVKFKSLRPKLYGDYGFWNPSPVYGGGFPYPGPVPHGSVDSKQRHKKPQWTQKLCFICSSTLLLVGKAFGILVDGGLWKS